MTEAFLKILGFLGYYQWRITCLLQGGVPNEISRQEQTESMRPETLSLRTAQNSNAARNGRPLQKSKVTFFPRVKQIPDVGDNLIDQELMDKLGGSPLI